MHLACKVFRVHIKPHLKPQLPQRVCNHGCLVLPIILPVGNKKMVLEVATLCTVFGWLQAGVLVVLSNMAPDFDLVGDPVLPSW